MGELANRALAKQEGSLDDQLKKVQVRTHSELRFTSHLQDLLKEGKSDDGKYRKFGLTYGHAILASVVYERYEQAEDELDRVMDIQIDYPDFGDGAGRYIQHAKSLVKALKAKRSVGKLPHVSRAKQKELIAALTEHFKDLRACLVNIEKIERRIRAKDLSASRYFLVTTYWSGLAVFIASFLFYGVGVYWYAVNQFFAYFIESSIINLLHLLEPIWPF